MKIKKIMLLTILLFGLCGCWDYKEINDLDIVTGIAIDKDGEEKYKLTYEIVDMLGTSKDNSIKSKYIEVEGETLFTAFYNAKRKLINELYLGDNQIIIISHLIAEKEGVQDIIESFLRNGQTRETTKIILSLEDDASSILKSVPIDYGIVSFEIKKAIENSFKNSSLSIDTNLYHAYSMLNDKGRVLILPAVHLVDNNEDKVCQTNGIALFKGDKIFGHLTPLQTKHYLFLTNQLTTGIITLDYEKENDISLLIKDNATKMNYRYQNQQLYLNYDINLQVDIIEARTSESLYDNKVLKKIQEKANITLCQRLMDLYKYSQDDLQHDIFDVANKIYHQDPALFYQLNDNWPIIYQNAQVNINFKTHIISTGILEGKT